MSYSLRDRCSQFIHREAPVQDNVAVSFDLIFKLKKEQSASIQIGREVQMETFDVILSTLFGIDGDVTQKSAGHRNIQWSIDENHEIDEPPSIGVGSP